MPERRKTLFVPPALHRRFKVACIGQGVTMQDQAEALIGAWLDQIEGADDGERGPPPARRKRGRAKAPP